MAQPKEVLKPDFKAKFVAPDCRTSKAILAKLIAETGDHTRYINIDGY